MDIKASKITEGKGLMPLGGVDIYPSRKRSWDSGKGSVYG